MKLKLRSFSTTVAAAMTAAQGASPKRLDLAVGSPGRALLESVATLGLWLQAVAVQLLTVTRLSTSAGEDADSFVADFGMTRLPGTAATGEVAMTSFSPSSQSAVIAPGVVVKTISNVAFAVVPERGHPAWSAQAGGYVRPEGVASVSVPVQAQAAGGSGNVGAGAVCLLGSAVSGIDIVTNPAAFTNGSDKESDAALRARFVTYIASHNSATLEAIEAAARSVQDGIFCETAENIEASGRLSPGTVVVWIDDGSGGVPDPLLDAVRKAVEAVRGAGITVQVVRPAVIRATVVMSVSVTAEADPAAIRTEISAAIAAYLNQVPIGKGASYSRLIQIAYATSPQVTNVSQVTLNGGVIDLPAVHGRVVRAGSVHYV